MGTTMMAPDSGMTDTRTNVWLRAERLCCVTLSAISVVALSMWAPIAHTDIVNGAMKGWQLDKSRGIYADEHRLALNRCIERIKSLTELQLVYTQKISLLQPGKPTMQQPIVTQPSSLKQCRAQEDMHKNLVAVYEQMISELTNARVEKEKPEGAASGATASYEKTTSN